MMLMPTDWKDWLSSLIFFMLLFFVLPRLFIWQMVSRIENGLFELENMVNEGKNLITSRVKRFGIDKRRIKNFLDEYLNFFVIEPVDLDPSGILKKLKYILDQSEDRFLNGTKKLLKNIRVSEEDVMNISMALKAVWSLNSIKKTVKHYLYMFKKHNNPFFLAELQMIMPLLMKVARAELKCTKAFLDNEPIGDSIGPLIVTTFISKKVKDIAKDIICSEEEIEGRKVYIVRAKGPGGRLGEIADAVRYILKKDKNVEKIITVDAASKLEGEETGSVASGVGVAIGGLGYYHKAFIEEIASEKGIDLDAIAIKMDAFEAIEPMNKKIIRSITPARKKILELIREVDEGKSVILIGVGNSVGIGNTGKDASKVIEKIKRKKEVKKKRKKFFIFRR